MTGPIEWIVEEEDVPEALLHRMSEVAACCLKREGVSRGNACGRIVSDDEIKGLNRTMRGVDRITDVLSFPNHDFGLRTAGECPALLLKDGAFLGDFVISLPQARLQAEEYGHSLTREMGYLTAHAMFHLMGYDHESAKDAAEMRKMEKAVMDELALYREDLSVKTYSDLEMLEMAKEVMKRAYVPYSGYRVGACLLSSDGRVFSACNVENASYGLAICAERSAVVQAVAAGCTKFTKIAVVGETGEAWPCGACRQVLNEFSDDMTVLCARAGDEPVSVPLSELLPRAFSLNTEVL